VLGAGSEVGGLCRRSQLRFRAEQATIVPGRPDPPCGIGVRLTFVTGWRDERAAHGEGSEVGGLCRRSQMRFRAEQAPIVPGRPDPPCALPICALCEICGLFFPPAVNLPVAENHGFDGAKPYVEEAGNRGQFDICDWLEEVDVPRLARSVVVGD
jgi:hypothetical protein